MDEFSLVDKPANPLARIVLTKRAPEEKPVPEQKDTSVLRKIAQALGFAPDVVVDTNKRVENDGGKWIAYDDAGAKIGEFDTEDEAREAAYGEKKKMAEQPKNDEPTPEVVSKAEFAKLQERLEKAEADATAQAEKVAKMENERRDAEFAARAATYAPLPIKADTFAPILRKCADALTEDENKELDRILTAAAAMAKAGNVTKEIGSGSQDEGTAAAKVAAKLDELRKAHPAKSEPQLRTMIWKADPELRRAYENEQQAPAGR